MLYKNKTCKVHRFPNILLGTQISFVIKHFEACFVFFVSFFKNKSINSGQGHPVWEVASQKLVKEWETATALIHGEVLSLTESCCARLR